MEKKSTGSSKKATKADVIDAVATSKPEPAPRRPRAKKDLASADPEASVTVFELAGYHDAPTVSVAGCFNDWSPTQDALQRNGDRWVIAKELAPGTHQYKFVIDGVWIVDPANPEIAFDEYGNSNSVRVV
ncbi:MAG: glycogen-binding domain-containing protein [Capsulimonadaceae bacterium]